MQQIAEAVSEFIMRKNRLCTHQEIADFIAAELRNLNRHAKVTVGKLHAYISKARFELEAKGDGTIVNESGHGFRFARAQSHDLTIFAVKHIKRTVMMADRANRLAPLVNEALIPQVIEDVFSNASK